MIKRYKLVMLRATKGSSNLWLMHNKSQGLMYLKTASDLDGYSQHLYVISNDRVKKGDWFVDTQLNTLCKASQDYRIIPLPSTVKKVIASSDPEITPDALLHEYFLKEYIEAYNNRKQLTDVCLEVELKYYECYNYHGQHLDRDCSCKGGMLIPIFKPVVREDKTVINHSNLKEFSIE